MLKRNKQESTIPTESRDSNLVFTVNKSIGDFKFGTPVSDYISAYEYNYIERTDKYEESRDFYVIPSIGLDLTVDESNLITDIICNKYCYWEDTNLIGLNIDKLIDLIDIKPDKIEKMTVCLNQDDVQNQTVYDFDSLGIIVWTYRKKIRRIICYQNE